MSRSKKSYLLSSVFLLLAATGCDQGSSNALSAGRTEGDGSFGPFDQEIGFDGKRDPIVIDYASPLEGVSSFGSGNGHVRGKNGTPININPVSQNPYAN